MPSYRERNRIKQNFDDWAKGINNQLANLRKQGFDNVAQYNIDVLRADGWEIRTDKNGNEVLSRAGKNKEQYRQNETYETAKAKRESLVSVKEAKTMQPDKLKEMTTPTTKDYNPPYNDLTDNLWEDTPDINGDEFEGASDWYNLAEILAQAIAEITDDSYNIYGAMEVLKEARGNDLNIYKSLARDYIYNLRNANIDDYYD